MHNHQVYFWLNDSLSDSARKEFETGLQTLIGISLVKGGYFGKPADTHRPVVDNTYSYGLTLQFESTADQNEYQVHPIHKVFVGQHAAKWTRVLVYDVVSE